MATSKIHCDYFEIYNVDWANLNLRQVNRLIEVIQTMELVGDPPNLHGFVGVQRLETVVGGFFAIQHEDQRVYYDRDKQYKIERDAPSERVLFVLLARTGKLLLQVRKFGNPNLSMPQVRDLFRDTLNEAFRRVGIGFTLGFYAPDELTPTEKFIEEFGLSTRVANLIVENPDPSKIPDGFVYYNPQKERNEIIAGSHKHDYLNYKRVDLEATSTGDIKSTHIGKDLVVSGRPVFMRYFVEQAERFLRQRPLVKIEMHVDVGVLELSVDQLRSIMDILHKERANDIDTPTQTRSGYQRTLFDRRDDDEDDDEEENLDR